MKRSIFTKNSSRSACYQKGGMLIESLMGMLILALIGGGIMHATARMANAQREMTITHIAVDQMRNMLMSRSLGGADLCGGQHSIALPGQVKALTMTVKGCSLVPAHITGIKIDGAEIDEQTIQSVQPLVLEIGEGDTLISIGGVAANGS